MNLEYEISLEYDRDRLQAYWEHFINKGKIIFIPCRYFPICMCLFSVGLIIWGVLEQNIDDSSLLFGAGISCFFLSILLFFMKS